MKPSCKFCSICGKYRLDHTCMQAAYCKSKTKGNPFQPRKTFSKAVKQATLERQNGRCARCSEYAINMQYHHKHGRDDNSLEYCVALCLDCHRAEHSGCIIGFISG